MNPEMLTLVVYALILPRNAWIFLPSLRWPFCVDYFQRTQRQHANSVHGAPTLLILIVSSCKKPSQEKVLEPFTSQKALQWERRWVPERQWIGWRVSSEPQSQE